LGNTDLDASAILSQVKEKDWELYNLIGCFISMNGYPPSVRELAKLLNYGSSSTVHSRLDRLESFGFITRVTNSPRTISITGRAEELLRSRG